MLLRRLLSVAIGKGDIAVQGVCNHLPDAFSRRFSEAQRLSVSKVPPEFSQFATDVRDLMLQGYSRYSLREPLHFGADFPGLDNNDGVGDARRPDEAMVVAVTAA